MVFSDGSAMWIEWRMAGLLRGSTHEECAGSHSVGRPQKRWIDSVNDGLKKRGLNVRQTKRMIYDKNEWQKFVKGDVWPLALRISPCLDEMLQL